MKGEVEVTFKCEGCGTTLLVSKHNRPETAVVDIHDTVTIDDITCPNCAKLHYGPLTEEMVAEALWEAMRKDDPYVSAWAARGDNPVLDEDFNREARFVLRLLNDLNDQYKLRSDCDAWVRSKNDGVDWRERLLDLARQK